MRILITGASGFVAPHLVAALKPRLAAQDEIVLSGREAPGTDMDGFVSLDIADRAAVEAAIARLAPTHIVHLAAISSPPAAGADPDLTWRVNVGGTLAIARALLKFAPDCVLVFAGSGQVYGETANLGRALTEGDVLAPIGEYAVAKAAADLALGSMAKQGLRCVRLRPFNHTGPGQTEEFVLPSFAAQIARIEAGLGENIIRVGNLDVVRDFLDVRDVAEAYAQVVMRANDLPPAAILNIASGERHSISDLLRAMLAMSDSEIRVQQDPARMRPSDIPLFLGDATRARQLLDWQPRRSTEDMLRDLLAFARSAKAG